MLLIKKFSFFLNFFFKKNLKIFDVFKGSLGIYVVGKKNLFLFWNHCLFFCLIKLFGFKFYNLFLVSSQIVELVKSSGGLNTFNFYNATAVENFGGIFTNFLLIRWFFLFKKVKLFKFFPDFCFFIKSGEKLRVLNELVSLQIKSFVLINHFSLNASFIFLILFWKQQKKLIKKNLILFFCLLKQVSLRLNI